MNEYTVTLKIMNRERFVDFLDSVGPLSGTMELTVKVAEHPERIFPNLPSRPTETAQRRPATKTRRLRGSKVNETIIAEVTKQPKTIKELKQALENAGLSPGSLSTGLAVLQRTHVIERRDEGLYGLCEHSAKAAQ